MVNPSLKSTVKVGQSAKKSSISLTLNSAFQNRSKNQSNQDKSPKVKAGQKCQKHKSQCSQIRNSLSFVCVNVDPPISEVIDANEEGMLCDVMPPSDAKLVVFICSL